MKKPSELQRKLADLERSRLTASGEQFRTFFEGANDALLTIRDGSFVNCNKKALEMFRCTPEELLRQTPEQLSPRVQPDGKESAVKSGEMMMLALAGAPQFFEWQHCRCDGTLFDAEVSLNRSEYQENVELLAIIRDITERKRTEEALRESESRYRSLYSSMNEGFALHELIYSGTGEAVDYTILEVNPAYEAITGLPRKQTVGAKASELYKTGEPPYLGIYAEVAASGEPATFEPTFAPMAKSFRISVFSPAPGKFATVFEDVTSRKQTEEELRKTRDELEKRVEVRTLELARTVTVLQEEIAERSMMEEALRKSEERYALAAQGANDGIWDWDFETGEVYLSPRWKEMLGYGEGEFQDGAVEWKRSIHPDDYDRVIGTGRAFLKGNILSYQLEYRLRHKDGSYRWVLARGTCLRNAEGKAYRMAGSHTDITERKAVEETILRLNRLYAVLSETSQVIVRATDRDTLFRESCRIAVEHGGFRMAWVGMIDEASGQVKPAASSGNAEGYLDDIRISVTEEPAGLGPTGSAIRAGSYYVCNDFMNDPRTLPWRQEATKRNFQASAAIALKLNGKVIGALTMYAAERDFFNQQLVELLQEMAADISFALDNLDREARRREAEQALQTETAERLRAVEALRQKDQLLMQQSRQAAMGEMIGNIAHQWRQPLNTLGLMVQELSLSNELGEVSKEHLDASVMKIMQIIFHMSQTIDDFRNFFKPDKERIQFQVNQVVRKTVSLIEASFKEQRISIEVNAGDDLLINGHPNEYSQVLLNILLNARDAFLEKKVAMPQVDVKLFAEKDKVVVTVTDNAGGIAENIIDKIFDPYFTTKTPDKGTGIGLFMSKTIIEKNMHGTLSARNTGAGAEFRIEV